MRLKITGVGIIQIITLIIIAAFGVPSHTLAQESDLAKDLQRRIDTRSGDIKALEKEIAGYQSEITELNSKANSLSEELAVLDLTQKKLQADIELTQEKIDAKNLEIEQLKGQIGITSLSIEDNKRFMAEAFRRMGEFTNISFAKLVLGSNTVSQAWDSVVGLALVENDLQNKVTDLGTAKKKLETNKQRTEAAKHDLLDLQEQLNAQKKVVQVTKDEQNKLLRDTKNSEANYQKLVKDKLALKNAFEQELQRYEADLKLAVDLSKLPKAGSGVLSWPVENVNITQYFGNTPFATNNPQIYSGGGHNGIDFAASIGTPIKAALTGTIVGTGNTDLAYGCYSLGKWILIKHPNGLSTLYAHLSHQTASFGTNVSTGEIIGYSGNTGYTTGPHLHFGVYASSGIEIRQFTNSKNCKDAVMPVATFKAYLNPLSYLPGISI